MELEIIYNNTVSESENKNNTISNNFNKIMRSQEK